jgi:UDP-N-acetylmuramyl pentapeptide synthase
MSGKKKFRVWWDQKEGIIRNKAWGDFDEQDAKVHAAQIINLVNSQPGKVAILNDLTEAGKASSRARKIFVNLIKNKKVTKHAFWGKKTVPRVVVSFIINFAGVKNARYFSTKNEALKWLKQRR